MQNNADMYKRCDVSVLLPLRYYVKPHVGTYVCEVKATENKIREESESQVGAAVIRACEKGEQIIPNENCEYLWLCYETTSTGYHGVFNRRWDWLICRRGVVAAIWDLHWKWVKLRKKRKNENEQGKEEFSMR